MVTPIRKQSPHVFRSGQKLRLDRQEEEKDRKIEVLEATVDMLTQHIDDLFNKLRDGEVVWFTIQTPGGTKKVLIGKIEEEE
jgi:hypothetical protein